MHVSANNVRHEPFVVVANVCDTLSTSIFRFWAPWTISWIHAWSWKAHPWVMGIFWWHLTSCSFRHIIAPFSFALLFAFYQSQCTKKALIFSCVRSKFSFPIQKHLSETENLGNMQWPFGFYCPVLPVSGESERERRTLSSSLAMLPSEFYSAVKETQSNGPHLTQSLEQEKWMWRHVWTCKLHYQCQRSWPLEPDTHEINCACVSEVLGAAAQLLAMQLCIELCSLDCEQNSFHWAEEAQGQIRFCRDASWINPLQTFWCHLKTPWHLANNFSKDHWGTIILKVIWKRSEQGKASAQKRWSQADA